MLPPYTGGTPTSTGISTNAADFYKRAAYYNWNFVYNDGSYGVHNAKYAAAILRASINNLKQGFVDANNNGIPDSWEMANFGNLTSVTATSDHDHDGLTDIQEYYLGTNPNSADTDGDGFSDYTEVLAGTDPLNANSRPGTNQVVLLPAYELGYTPSTNLFGTTLQFQSARVLGSPNAWTGLGQPFVASNAWFYQLITPRDATQRFFRVVAP